MREKEKELAGSKVSDFIKDGMLLGLGTGSTFFYAIRKIGEMIKEGLKIKAVSTSRATTELAKSLGIPLVSIDEVEEIDLTIDGADEVDLNFNGIKGGGGALLFEKIVAKISKKNLWVVDSSKLVKKLGKFPLPVEVVPFGKSSVLKKFEKLGFNPKLRMSNGKEFITDSGNFIIDLNLGEIKDPYEMEVELNMIPGVVENGLFLDVVDIVIVGKGDGVEIFEKGKSFPCW
ncbi:MAG: ribose-5-phosphate isomerase RpiA [candidate division WOR-3 bacterium]